MSGSSPPPKEDEGAKLLSEKEETSSLKFWFFSAGVSSLFLDQNGILGGDVVVGCGFVVAVAECLVVARDVARMLLRAAAWHCQFFLL